MWRLLFWWVDVFRPVRRYKAIKDPAAMTNYVWLKWRVLDTQEKKYVTQLLTWSTAHSVARTANKNYNHGHGITFDRRDYNF